VHQYSETLRVELAPLNVKVLTVVCGSIITNMPLNSNTPALPSGSRYGPCEKALEDMRNNVRNYSLTSADDFAHQLVAAVLRGATGRIYLGANSFATHWGQHVLPMSMIVSAIVTDVVLACSSCFGSLITNGSRQDNLLCRDTGLDEVGRARSESRG
jgi:short-subunit dehydrogenase